MSHVLPSIDQLAFHCPFCGVFSQQTWHKVVLMRLAGNKGPATPKSATGAYGGSEELQSVFAGRCTACEGLAVWVNEAMVHPAVSDFGPAPAEDLPEDIKNDFNEARSIATRSPRGAAALLRLCLQTLCKFLGEKGENINDDIGSLVKKGLAAEVQEACDTLRVFGNAAVHPGEIDLKDDQATAEALMTLLNYVVGAMITEPKKRKALFGKVPPGAQAAIGRRDAPKP